MSSGFVPVVGSAPKTETPPHPRKQSPSAMPRKRSKVSRACDACRKKKIRCDSNPDDEGRLQCSSCKKAGIECCFYRVPLKRGPSKGQRKDLQPSSSSSPDKTPLPPSLRSPAIKPSSSPPPPTGNFRKRSFSITCAALAHNNIPADSHSLLPPKPQQLSPESPSLPSITNFFNLKSLSKPRVHSPPPSSIHQLHAHSFLLHQPPLRGPALSFPPHTSAKSPPPTALTAPKSSGPLQNCSELDLQHLRKNTHQTSSPNLPNKSGSVSRSNSVPNYLPSTDDPQHPPSSPPNKLRKLAIPSPQSLLTAHWNDLAIDSYYHLVHPVIPILPPSKVRLQAWLQTTASCPESTSLAIAILTGVSALYSTFSHHHPTPSPQILPAISTILALPQSHPSRASPAFVVLLIIQHLLTQNDSIWLSMAISVAYQLNMHLPKSLAPPLVTPKHRYDDDDDDDDDNLPLSSDTDTSDDDYYLSSRSSSLSSIQESLHKRLFHVLVLLDAMHSSLAKVPGFIPASLVYAADSDPVARVCVLFKRALDISPSSSPGLQADLYRTRLSLERSWDTAPSLKGLYLCAEITAAAAAATSSATSALHPTDPLADSLASLVGLLGSPLMGVSPLAPFFAQTAASHLCALAATVPATTSPGTILLGNRVAALLTSLLDTRGNMLDATLRQRACNTLSTLRKQSASPPGPQEAAPRDARYSEIRSPSPLSTSSALDRLASLAEKVQVV